MTEQKTDKVKPVTTFNKQYVIERIEARLFSLVSRIAEAQAKLDKHDDAQATVSKTYIERAATLFERLLKNISDLSPTATAEEVIVAASRISDAMRDTFNVPSVSYQDRRDVELAAAQIASYGIESDTLEHTLAYLRESPLEEYSITVLQRLGLLEAVKFSIPTR